jgi:phospholipid transport system substrate-binding protein
VRTIPKIVRLVILLPLLLYAQTVHASEVTDKVKANIDEALKVLKDQSLTEPEKTGERRARLRSIVNGWFDFEEMSKRSLARHWRKMTGVEKEEFVTLFGNFLEGSYIDKIEANSDAEVLYVGEIRNKNKAVVKTKVITKQDTEIPIHYRLLNKKEDWVVYDVVIEGVSLVSNYRTQFNKIIQSSSYEGLVKRLKSRTEQRAASP